MALGFIANALSGLKCFPKLRADRLAGFLGVGDHREQASSSACGGPNLANVSFIFRVTTVVKVCTLVLDHKDA